MIKDVPAVALLIEKELKKFTEVAVVGISGGIDSAVVASVCVSALGADNVYLVSMPYDDIDRKTFNARSTELAVRLAAHHFEVPIGETADCLIEQLRPNFKSSKQGTEFHRLTEGNTRSRMRMSVLYAVAGELSFRLNDKPEVPLGSKLITPGDFIAKRVRVIGTGNASEDLIGYDTKGGDALADLFVIGDIFKREVYQLGAYYGVPDSILTAKPSAGLYKDQTDEDELGYTYDELEPALMALHAVITRGVSDEKIVSTLPEFEEVELAPANFVIDRFKKHAHKHRAPQVVKVRDTKFVS
jgi:NAD+ synthase